MKSLAEHWDSKYSATDYFKLGWHENVPSSSLGMLEESGISKDGKIFVSGGGTSLFIDKLLQNGFSNITVADISEDAITKVQNRLGNLSDKVEWLVGDLLDESLTENIGEIDYWHDRAVLHFFTEEEDRKKYFNIVNRKVRPNGFVMFAQFDIDEIAKMCSSLPVHRYSLEMYEEGLGPNFKTLKFFNEIYSMPSGDFRNYLYALFQKVN